MSRGYRLLTSGGPLAALAVLIFDAATVLDSWSWWRGDGLWAVNQLGSSLLFGLPLLLVLNAVPPVLRGGVGTDRSLLPVAPFAERARRFLSDTVPVLGVHGAFVVGALVISLTNGDRPDGSTSALCVAVHALAIAFTCAAGRAIGELGAHPAALAVAAAAGIALTTFAEHALPVAAGGYSYVGIELVPDAYLVSLGVLAAAVAVLLVRPSGRWGPAAAAVAIGGVVLAGQNLDEPELRLSGATPTSCARVADVDVCVYPGYRYMLSDLAGQVRTSLQAFDRAGIDPHLVAIKQSALVADEDPGTASYSFSTEELERSRVRSQSVWGNLTHPAWCPRVSSPEPLPAGFDARSLQVLAWIEHAVGATDEEDFRRRVPKFAGFSEEKQVRLVQEFLDRNRTCEGLG